MVTVPPAPTFWVRCPNRKSALVIRPRTGEPYPNTAHSAVVELTAPPRKRGVPTLSATLNLSMPYAGWC
jgi:hypothetical protein